jgi:hypothetical protein
VDFFVLRWVALMVVTGPVGARWVSKDVRVWGVDRDARSCQGQEARLK